MTILGQHTIAETEELRAQKDADIKAYTDAYERIKDAWIRKDPVSARAWGDDWAEFLKRWLIAKLKAGAIITSLRSVVLSDNAVPAEPAWEILMRALMKEEGRFQRGDLADFVDRWAKAGLPSPEIITKQPITTDVDLEVFKQTDKATRALESGAKDITPWLIGGAVAAGLFMFLNRK